MKDKKKIKKFIINSCYRSYNEIVEFIDNVDVNYLHLCINIHKIDGLIYVLNKNFDYRQKIKVCYNYLIIKNIKNTSLIDIMFKLLSEHNYNNIPNYGNLTSQTYNYYNEIYHAKLRETKIIKLYEYL